MCDLDSFMRAQQPHQCAWEPLSERLEWCPTCGHVRVIQMEEAS